MIGRLMEVIVYAKDMDAQVRFYRDVLGFEVTYPAGKDDYSEEFWVTLDTGACVLALHGGGTQDFGDNAPKFVFEVEDIQAAHQMLQEAGVKINEVREAAPGVQVADAWDPEGNAFSIEVHEH